VEIELEWTDVVLGAVRHVLSLRRSQFFERVRVQAHTGQPFELSSTSTNRIRSGGCGKCRRPLRSRSRHAPTTPPRAQKPAPKQTAQLAYCSGASPVDAGSGELGSSVADLALPPGAGCKRALRSLALSLELPRTATLVKRAIQFGTRIAPFSNRLAFGAARRGDGSADFDVAKLVAGARRVADEAS
jgi:hypothetical protein